MRKNLSGLQTSLKYKFTFKGIGKFFGNSFKQSLWNNLAKWCASPQVHPDGIRVVTLELTGNCNIFKYTAHKERDLGNYTDGKCTVYFDRKCLDTTQIQKTIIFTIFQREPISVKLANGHSHVHENLCIAFAPLSDFDDILIIYILLNRVYISFLWCDIYLAGVLL